MNSIILPAHNAEDTLPETIRSIEAQTSQDFEVVFIDDASTDRTLEIMEKYSGRKQILKNETHMALPYSLNKAIRAAKGEYIFRMDSDDLMMPERIEKQAAFLGSHPEIGVVSSTAVLIDKDGKEVGFTGKEMNPAEVKCALLFGNPLTHPSVAMRKEFALELYDEEYLLSQDYEFWGRLIKKTEFFVMKEPMVKYRIAEMSLEKTEKKRYFAEKALRKNLENYFEPSKDDIDAALTLAGWDRRAGLGKILRFESRLLRAKGLNKAVLLKLCAVKTIANGIIPKSAAGHYFEGAAKDKALP